MSHALDKDAITMVTLFDEQTLVSVLKNPKLRKIEM